MNLAEREKLMYQIIDGKKYINVLDKSYVLLPPSFQIKKSANKLYCQILYQERFSGEWLTEEECLKMIYDFGLYDGNLDYDIKACLKKIDNLKLNLYRSLVYPHKTGTIRYELKQEKEKFGKLNKIRYMFYPLTLEGFAETVQQEYIIFRTVKQKIGKKLKRVWRTFESVDAHIMSKICSFVVDTHINEAQIREIARSEPWVSYWYSNKNIFRRPLDLTPEQRTLLFYSKLYESAYKSLEPPPKMVIEDDDLFDGWLLHEKEKQNQQPKSSKRSSRNDPQELFIPVKTQEEVQQVLQNESIDAKIIKRQRNSIIKNKGTVKESELINQLKGSL